MTEALRTISERDSEQRKTVINALLELSANKNWSVQRLMADELGAIPPSDPEQLRHAIQALVNLAASRSSDFQNSDMFAALRSDAERDWSMQRSVANALRSISERDPAHRKTVIDALLKLSANKELKSQRIAAAQLGAIAPGDPGRLKTVVQTLVNLAASSDSDVQQSAATALGAVSPSDPELLKTVVQTLVNLAASGNSDAQQSAAAALGAIGPSDPEELKTVVETLVNLAAGGDTHVQESAAIALGAIGPSDPEQLKTVVQTLVTLSAGGDMHVQQSAATALGAIGPSDPEQLKTVVQTRVTLSARGDPDVRQAAATALAAVSTRDLVERKTAVSALLKLVENKDPKVQQIAAAELGRIPAGDLNESNAIIETLLTVAAVGGDYFVEQSAAKALRSISKRDPAQRKTVMDALLRFAENKDPNVQKFAADELGAIPLGDPDDSNTAIKTLVNLAAGGDSDVHRSATEALLKLAASGDPKVRQAAAAAVRAISPTDSEHLETIIALLFGNFQREESDDLISPDAALVAITPSEPKQIKAVVETLVKFVAQAKCPKNYGFGLPAPSLGVEPFGRKSIGAKGRRLKSTMGCPYVNRAFVNFQPASDVLRHIGERGPEQGDTVLKTLVKLAADGDPSVQSTAAEGLGALNTKDPIQRKSILDALVTLIVSDAAEVQEAVAAALLKAGPLDTAQLEQLLVIVDQESPRAKPRLRANGWAFNGSLPGPDPEATLLTFTGHPTPVAENPLPSDPESALQVLGVFERSWPYTPESKNLQIEIAERTIAIVSNACTAASTGSGTLGKLAEPFAEEWGRTLAWLRSFAGAQESLPCWQGDGRNTIVQLRDEFRGVDGLGAEARALDENIAAASAAPIIGQSVLAASGWALIWIAFLAVFPYSARVRGAYLHSEKMRGWLSLGFLPALIS